MVTTDVATVFSVATVVAHQLSSFFFSSAAVVITLASLVLAAVVVVTMVVKEITTVVADAIADANHKITPSICQWGRTSPALHIFLVIVHSKKD